MLEPAYTAASLPEAHSAHRALYTRNTNIYADPTSRWTCDSSHPVYMIIDLKSFYASVECVLRGLDPMTTDLVVADPDRGEGTICLAVSPSLKKKGVGGRARVYEIPRSFEYITAPPRMAEYEKASARVYSVYLQYFSRDDIHVYSCDEAFIDVTNYLELYQMTPKELGMEVMNAVLDATGLRSTCGIGTNLYLAKVALDIVSKHSPDFIGILDMDSYQATLWDHRPLSDFWMIAGGKSRRLAKYGIHTMRELARAAFCDDSFLYREFGIDAEILIDHAFGAEPVRMADIKGYGVPGLCGSASGDSGSASGLCGSASGSSGSASGLCGSASGSSGSASGLCGSASPSGRHSHSISSGQVLLRDYNFEDAEVVVKEMVDSLCLQMASQHVATASITFFISYSDKWTDADGLPAFATGATISIRQPSDSEMLWRPLIAGSYERTTRRDAPIRRIGICCNRVQKVSSYQYSLFRSNGEFCTDLEEELRVQDRDRHLHDCLIQIRAAHGKNAVLKGTNLERAGTQILRNCEIGGHKSGHTDSALQTHKARTGAGGGSGAAAASPHASPQYGRTVTGTGSALQTRQVRAAAGRQRRADESDSMRHSAVMAGL